eukprot:scaffold3210_cov402-Prasinococcus_capsulatus_cf.AAC.2
MRRLACRRGGRYFRGLLPRRGRRPRAAGDADALTPRPLPGEWVRPENAAPPIALSASLARSARYLVACASGGEPHSFGPRPLPREPLPVRYGVRLTSNSTTTTCRVPTRHQLALPRSTERREPQERPYITASLSATRESGDKQVDTPTRAERESRGLEQVSGEEFVSLIAELGDQPYVVDWAASWCRKCIYLKPKLGKLSSEFPKLRFFFVDVNLVPGDLVRGNGITKMPTIQVWKGGHSIAEVIGGHDSATVMQEVRDMIRENTDIHDRHWADIEAISDSMGPR